ncbi:TonB-dependent siderophore receptor [uncultured Lacinutrix sp.]|uniref:TonB-dependent receptor plug domain-containing protein n=1 Tax=uncultured Lacinutrix sp. TaxID=574032 RepID=UPI002628A8A2|nr:TonB-dependent receptor plug domain-containing protein [uncultured Lacinutrix sp.]
MRRLYVVIILIFFYNTLCSQENNNTEKQNTPLDVFLLKLEKQFDIVISYNSKIAEKKSVNIKISSLKLDDILALIEEQTQTIFTKINNRNLVLRAAKKHIPIRDKVLNLNSITLNSYFTSGFYKQKDGSILAIPDKMQLLPGFSEPDVMQSLQLIPGIQSPDETATGINIRGGTPDQNLILWDGIKMYQYDHFFGSFSSFNPNSIQDVKLYKNASLARYGNHLSGVIDIHSNYKIPNKVKAGIGSNLIYSDAYLKAPIAKHSALFITARRSFTEVFRTITFEKFSEQVFQNTKITDNNQIFSDVLSKTNTDYYFNDYTAKFITKLSPSSTLNISGIYFKNKLDFLSQFEEINQQTEDNLDITNIGITSNWEKQWNSKFNSKLQINYTDYNYDYEGDELLSNLFKYKAIKKNDIKELSLNVFTKYKINKNTSLVNGYNLTNNNLSYKLIDQSKVIFDSDILVESQNSKSNIHSLFNEYSYSNEKWHVNAGIKTDYYDNTSKLYFQPTISLTRLINRNIKLNLSIEKQYQYISQIIEFETRKFGLENQVWTIADNNEIPVIESKQFSFGINFKKNNWNIDIEPYYKKIKNITSVTKGFNREINTFSIGKSEVKGIDMLIKKRIKNFTSLISYSLTKNDFTFNNLNNNMPFAGNFDIRHYLTLIQSFKLRNIEFSLGWKYKSPRPYTPANGLTGNNANTIAIDYDAINSKYLNDYHRLDFSTKYKVAPFKNKNIKATIGFSLLNIYNRKSILNRTYRIILNTDNATYQLREINKFSLGRIPNLTLRLDF